MTREEFNGYMFGDPTMRNEMKYLVVTDGDLDSNGCYSFMNKEDLFKWVQEQKEYHMENRIQAIFEISDITNYFLDNE